MSWERTGRKISLHGLGFVQVELGGDQRLHVWHPDLPRRSCFEHSQVHDHRFGFESTVLVGGMTNIMFAFDEEYDTQGTGHVAYRHKGKRGQSGNRPWKPYDVGSLVLVDEQHVQPGETYLMRPYVFHQTLPHGPTATLMRKTSEDIKRGATSLCSEGVEPDVDFDRFQLSDERLWHYVRRVLDGT